MTPKAAFLARVRRRLRKAEPSFTRAYMEGLRKLLDSLPVGKLEEIIAAGGTDRLLSTFFTDDHVRAAFSRMRATVQNEGLNAVLFFAQDVPGVEAASISTTFGVVNPRVIEAIRTMDDRVMQRLGEGIRESVRSVAEEGYVEGWGPRETARKLRQYIGLGPSEQEQVANFEDALRNPKSGHWKNYARRDHRFDATLTRAMKDGERLSEDTIRRMVEAYTRRRSALAAETNARTFALNTYKSAQQTAWQSAMDQGIISGDGLFKQWMGVADSRERPEHFAMNGEIARFEEAYSNGQMIPGEDDFNCRCWSRMFARL